MFLSRWHHSKSDSVWKQLVYLKKLSGSCNTINQAMLYSDFSGTRDTVHCYHVGKIKALWPVHAWPGKRWGKWQTIKYKKREAATLLICTERAKMRILSCSCRWGWGIILFQGWFHHHHHHQRMAIGANGWKSGYNSSQPRSESVLPHTFPPTKHNP